MRAMRACVGAEKQGRNAEGVPEVQEPLLGQAEAGLQRHRQIVFPKNDVQGGRCFLT